MLLVSCALIVFEQKVLAAQRSAQMKMPLQWEFPGGKIEQGETPAQAAIREIREELDVEISIIGNLSAQVHHYEQLSIQLFPFIAVITKGEVHLKEHLKYGYFNSNELQKLNWSGADVKVLEEYFSGR